ncbi:MAG TPA: sigma-54 dependent transcriptional regulator [Oligoflexia bacterium]|nr:sigma-54 dependent transcriptional regulator [Oligoflexia bacterium]
MLARKKKILLVDDDRNIHLANKYILKDYYECISAYDGDEARIILQSQSVDLILLDIHMRKYEEGLEFIPIFREIDPDIDIVISSSNKELELAARAVKAGASAYLIKENALEQLLITVESVLSKRELIRQNQHLFKDRKRSLEKASIIGESKAMKKLLQDIEKIRRVQANVVITAETGCGKELVARHIGVVDGAPFVTVDSSTITHSMAESMLFGHEKGAFTGAVAQSKGLFEEANGGVIYFDEISNMPLDIQTKLLRVVQEKEIMRLGSTKIIPLSFRVICATNRDLEKMVGEGKFKEDLFQRLNVVTLSIPPLRDRLEDFSLLVESFFKKHGDEASPKRFSDSATELLLKYSWPGNVRELSNLIANMCALIHGQEEVEVEDLPERLRIQTTHMLRIAPPAQEPTNIDINEDFYEYMRRLEGKALHGLYQSFSGNISAMSKKLKMSRSHLYSKLYAHGIHK